MSLKMAEKTKNPPDERKYTSLKNLDLIDSNTSPKLAGIASPFSMKDLSSLRSPERKSSLRMGKSDRSLAKVKFSKTSIIHLKDGN